MDSVDNTVTPSGTQGANPDISPSEGARSGDAATEGDGSLRGSDLARAALRAAKEAAGTKRKLQGKKTQAPHTGSRKRRRWSGAGADSRDPQRFGALLGKLAAERGWADQLANGEVFGRWTAIVGAEIAEHAKPLSLRDGELTVQASSTAWATQLRLLQRQLLVKIAKGVGDGVVKRLKVHGPAAPSWRYGPRHVAGRGPRDTYG
ncbi:DciA family protein [Kibdelosporangium persicum]|uniref:DciA family protein n=1 Tax=Kibdelosporangium persicum TaxID=2698649 RepID=UPI0039EEA8E3